MAVRNPIEPSPSFGEILGRYENLPEREIRCLLEEHHWMVHQTPDAEPGTSFQVISSKFSLEELQFFAALVSYGFVATRVYPVKF